MKPSLQLRLSQHLALTPQLQQSIRLLQLSTLELNQEIEQAMADNPLLERDDDPLGGTLHLRSDGSIENAPATPATPEINGNEPENAAPELSDTTPDAAIDWGRGEARPDDDESNSIDWATARPSLQEHLRSQLSCTQASPRDRALVDLLIEALDTDGYLQQTLEELLAVCPESVEVDADELRGALRLLQSFDPPGVGRARRRRMPRPAA